MNHRLGVCSACKAQYKVPASFQADRAKCKACGGVVEIGPVGGAAPTAAAKPAPKPAPAAPARPVPARPVAATPKPVPAPMPKPAPRPVAEEPDSVRAAAAAAAERVRDAGRKSASASAAESERKSDAPERAKGGARAGAKAGAKSGAKAGGGRHGARKEKSKAPMLAAVVVLMVAGGGAAWFLTRGGEEGPQAAETTPDVAIAPVESAPEPAAEATPAETPVAETPVEGADAASDAPAAEAPPAAKPEEVVDLSVFPDETKLPGTSDEDWAAIQEWTATFLDANSGAAGNRARGKLLERGRESFPAVLNAMKRLDFSTDDGFRAGDLSQRYLMAVCNGSNFDWKYERDPAAVTFNKKVVRFWIKSWQQAREEPKAWAKLTKTTEEEALKLFAITGPFDKGAGASPEAANASSALDDL